MNDKLNDITILAKGGGMFEARVGGQFLCTSRTPLLTGARVLQARGIEGTQKLVMRHAGSEVIALRSTVAGAAGLTISEPDDRPAQFIKYQPHPKARP